MVSRHKDEAQPLDSDWLRAHPLPQPDNGADKNARGRVLAIGGCRTVPGGLLLTAEGALRAGAGKVQLATIADATLALGVAMPEAAIHALPTGRDGELGECREALKPLLERADAIIAGPAMGCREAAGRLLPALGDATDGATLVIDAAALMALPHVRSTMPPRRQPPILTPHIGEMAALLKCDAAAIEADRPAAVRLAARRFRAICVLKGPTSLVAAPDGSMFAYAGGGVGLATGGSGDVLAGIVAGLAARGTPPLEAALWAVWLHGEAGRRCSEQMGPLGFLARELLAHVPGLMRAL
ncbi:NAD(P)H-hydrate dehydratase [Novosphingobium cyanobacteriorum]|uniref:ADP-dependent (S)-NAD(P)H-hydrate dehydratase n=1 Tax=Novosphingobium cyanobacteriorum TaxID=3024215 RepID=A0ABT6CGQ3_9SPHN|nr:NAD(P)H-hydrate dehydratase [Novosphingobium cyanobacteriorum]MDF8333118.1 NAD(P)H-hydrate dehydratase [Novosphingobium cyanobacteriorum]